MTAQTQTEPITDVIFRIDKGEVIAIFPADPGTNQYDVTIYVHNGQHGSGDPWVLNTYRLATEDEYSDLKQELERIGYNLRVVKLMTATHKKARVVACAR